MKLTIYSDASFRRNSKEAYWGAVCYLDSLKIERSGKLKGKYKNSTQAEYAAAKVAIDLAKELKSEFKVDSCAICLDSMRALKLLKSDNEIKFIKIKGVNLAHKLCHSL